ncbi:MAG TPA: hypothetical protein HA254_03180 [Candidatus Diapherotrites archaeon]|uniref:Uncharacterized protein n=1 Tax=Candidatus Iainarchaeum sp. TaxID=3101447 RepID=A0A7J4IVU9_9ARCH|nr:hypothetical protein [Candidatus Diapherotrites archaeon]
MIQEAVGRQIAGEASRIFESYPFDYLKYRQGTYSEQDKHNVERCTNKMKEFFVLNAPIWLGIPEKKGRLITKLISLQNVAESSGNDLAKKESKFRLLVKKDRQMTSEVISLMLLMQKKLNPLKDHFSNRGSLLPQAESDQNTEIKHIAYWGFQSFRQELHLTLNACRQEIR